MKLTKQDFDLIKKCIAIVIDRKVESFAYILSNSDKKELAMMLDVELKQLTELENKLK